jgi:site-specific DNA recombinase
MKAIGYVRVSTERQAQEGISLEAQQAKIRAWCEANGHELVEVYVDAGISGRSMKSRVGLQNALDALKKDQVLVTYSLSRLARSLKDALVITEQIGRKKATLTSLSEQIDGTSAAGRMMMQMMLAFAEFESAVISERTTTAMQHKKATGQQYCHQTPYGFEAIEGRLVEVKREADVVAEIQAARNAGITLQAIADDLNGRGIPTKKGKQWQPATVHLLLKRSSLAA